MTAPAFAHDTIILSDSVDDPSPSGSFDWSAEPLRLCPTGCATVLDDDPSPSGSVDWSAEPLRLCRDADAVRHVDPSPVSVTVQPPSDADTCTDTEPRSSDVDAFSHQDRDIETQDTLLRLVSETFDTQDTQRERQREHDRLHLLARGGRCRSRSRSPLRPATDSDNDIGDEALRLSTECIACIDEEVSLALQNPLIRLELALCGAPFDEALASALRTIANEVMPSQHFYIGITRGLVWRMVEAPFRHAKRYDEMIGLVASTPSQCARLERELIRKAHAGEFSGVCDNKGLGGERTPKTPQCFVYVALCLC